MNHTWITPPSPPSLCPHPILNLCWLRWHIQFLDPRGVWEITDFSRSAPTSAMVALAPALGFEFVSGRRRGGGSGFSSSLHKIDELIAALLPLCLCPGWGRLGYGRESQLWHPPWCRYCSQPAGGHGGWQPREHSWPTYCCQVPGDTQRKQKQVESVYVCECVCLCVWRQRESMWAPLWKGFPTLKVLSKLEP